MCTTYMYFCKVCKSVMSMLNLYQKHSPQTGGYDLDLHGRLTQGRSHGGLCITGGEAFSHPPLTIDNPP